MCAWAWPLGQSIQLCCVHVLGRLVLVYEYKYEYSWAGGDGWSGLWIYLYLGWKVPQEGGGKAQYSYIVQASYEYPEVGTASHMQGSSMR